MATERLQFDPRIKRAFSILRLYNLLASHAYNIIIFGAMFCTLAVKFFHSYRTGLLGEYPLWILTDIAVLLGIEIVMTIVCFRWRRKRVIRMVTIIAAVVCIWSVINASWVIRTGTQILPGVLLPLLRDPLSSLNIIRVNLIKMPIAAFVLLGPSAVALTFFFFVLARPVRPNYSRKRFAYKIVISLAIVFIAVVARAFAGTRGSVPAAAVGLRYNCQLRAVTGFFFFDSARPTKAELARDGRKIPAYDQLKLQPLQKSQLINYNIVIVVLEGIQYKHTSLAEKQSNLINIY